MLDREYELASRSLRVKISAVVLLYNEEEVIDEFSERLLKSLRTLPLDYEVIFVVEGTDRTLEKVKNLAQADPRIRIDYNEKGLDWGRAIKKGLGLVDPESSYVLTIDSDLNHDRRRLSD